MYESATKFCRICLANDSETSLAKVSSFNERFTTLIGKIDVSQENWICIWCKIAWKRANDLITTAQASQEVLDKFNQDYSVMNTYRTSHGPYVLTYSHKNNNDVIVMKHEEMFDEEEGHTEEQTVLALSETNNHKINAINDVNVQLHGDNEFDDDVLKEIKLKEDEEVEVLMTNNQNQSLNFEENQLINKSRHKREDYEALKFEVKYLSVKEQMAEIEMVKTTEKYKKMGFHCESCGVGFLTEDIFEEHKKRHEKPTPHRCQTCGLYFTSRAVLSQHALAHRRRFACTVCGRTYTRWLHCVQHRYTCGDAKEIVVCEDCKKVFSNPISLDIHVKGVHKKEKKHTCSQCDRCFATKQRLTVHTRTHSNTRPFACSKCARKFITSSNLRAHFTVHAPAETKKFYCVECNLFYKTDKGLKRHWKESGRHMSKELGYTCEYCPKKFSSEKLLSSHVAHTHQTAYRCSVCEKTFSNNSNLKKHIRCVHADAQIDSGRTKETENT